MRELTASEEMQESASYMRRAPHYAQHATHTPHRPTPGAGCAACNVQHATRNAQRTAYSMHPALSQQQRCGHKHRHYANETCITQHPACNTQRASIQRTPCNMQRATSQCNMNHPTGRSTRWNMHHTMQRSFNPSNKAPCNTRNLQQRGSRTAEERAMLPPLNETDPPDILATPPFCTPLPQSACDPIGPPRGMRTILALVSEIATDSNVAAPLRIASTPPSCAPNTVQL
jgi:hypothetical protein